MRLRTSERSARWSPPALPAQRRAARSMEDDNPGQSKPDGPPRRTETPRLTKTEVPGFLLPTRRAASTGRRGVLLGSALLPGARRRDGGAEGTLGRAQAQWTELALSSTVREQRTPTHPSAEPGRLATRASREPHLLLERERRPRRHRQGRLLPPLLLRGAGLEARDRTA